MAPVFVDEAKKAVWTIDNPDAVKGFYGDHVTITATADAGKKSVHIDSIADCQVGSTGPPAPESHSPSAGKLW